MLKPKASPAFQSSPMTTFPESAATVLSQFPSSSNTLTVSFSPSIRSLFASRFQQDGRISCGHSQIELLLHLATHFSSSTIRISLTTFYPDDHRPYPFNHTDERVIGRGSENFDQWPPHLHPHCGLRVACRWTTFSFLLHECRGVLRINVPPEVDCWGKKTASRSCLLIIMIVVNSRCAYMGQIRYYCCCCGLCVRSTKKTRLHIQPWYWLSA